MGIYPLVTLAEARQAALANRRALVQGHDPRGGGIPTFEQAAEKVIRIHAATWTPGGGKSEVQWRASLRDYAMPILGHIRLDKITTEHLKRRFVEQGLEFALERKRRVRPPREVIFDGVFEARLVALACSQAPPGRKRWTLRLLAEKVVELGWVERVSVMTVQRTLKKTNCSLIGRSIGGSRPGAAPHS